MTILGRIICKLREWSGRRPVHSYKRPPRDTKTKTYIGLVKICRRCGLTKTVKPRKPKTQEIQK